jgi:aminoglycoside 6'-N-acetyltransferase I
MTESTTVVIRRVSRDDYPEWLRLRALLWPRADRQALADELDSLRENLMTPVFVAERVGGGLCGLLEAATRAYADGCDSSPVGYIEGWYVDEDVRGTGIGRLLVSEAEDWARDQGLLEMGSDTELDNAAGLLAHLALGYREIERAIHFAKRL